MDFGFILQFIICFVLAAMLTTAYYHAPSELPDLSQITYFSWIPGHLPILSSGSRTTSLTSRIQELEDFRITSQEQILELLRSQDDLERQLFSAQQRLRNLPRDHIGLRDFALRYHGASLVQSLTTSPSSSIADPNGAVIVLDDDIRPGRCWRFKGSSAQVGIALKHRVNVTHVTVDHAAPELVSSMGCAPRDIIFWGLIDGGVSTRSTLIDPAIALVLPRAQPLITAGKSFLPLAILSYDRYHEENIQTIPVLDYIVRLNLTFTQIVANVVTNWGDDATCLYRIRVHGSLA